MSSAAGSASLPSEMKAQVLPAYNRPYELTMIPMPSLKSPHDLLIQVTAASYCHTDAVLAAGQMGENMPPRFPHVGCHEFAGVVVKISEEEKGREDKSHSFKVGDRVGVPGRAFRPCGECFECAADDGAIGGDPKGYSVHCPRAQNLGLTQQGGFAEYAVVDSRQVAEIPEGLSDVDTAPLMCAGLTIFTALRKCQRLRKGIKSIGLLGAGGGLGHLGLQFAEEMGFERVVGIEAAEKPLALAKTVVRDETKTWIVDARQITAEETKRRGQTGTTDMGEIGLDAVVVLPESQVAFDYGMSLLKNHGLCVVVSFPKDGFHLAATDVVFRQIDIVGSLVGSNRQLREMLMFAANHNIKATSRSYALGELNELVEEYHRGGGGKLVVDMERS